LRRLLRFDEKLGTVCRHETSRLRTFLKAIGALVNFMAISLQSAFDKTAFGLLAAMAPMTSLAAKPTATPLPVVVPPPVAVTAIEPWAATPGASVEWTLTGKDIAEARAIWSTPELSMEPVPLQKGRSGQAMFKVTAPAATPHFHRGGRATTRFAA
jgi:hypothetical protein